MNKYFYRDSSFFCTYWGDKTKYLLAWRDLTKQIKIPIRNKAEHITRTDTCDIIPCSGPEEKYPGNNS